MFGPGFTSAPVHMAEAAKPQYLLVTNDMFSAIQAGKFSLRFPFPIS